MPRTGRRSLVLTVAVVVICLVSAAVLGSWALRGGDGSSAAGADHSDHAGESGHADHSQDAAAAGGHGEHDTAVLEGCDADAYHDTMMMFDPTAADGLLDSGCTWPYDASIAVEGGAENPSISASFEPRRYAEIFEVLTAERFGMCSVGRLPDDTVDGFVFGFAVALQPGGCADNRATVRLEIREYATRAWRDTAASAVDRSATPHVLVLGRWVIGISGDDAEGASRLASFLEPLGAATV